MKLLNTAKKITTAAALAAALLAGTAPKAAAQCPYTVGPLGRYIAPAIVQGMTATDDVTAGAGGAPSGAFLPFAGGVRFSTLPGSALGVGLELSDL